MADSFFQLIYTYLYNTTAIVKCEPIITVNGRIKDINITKKKYKNS